MAGAPADADPNPPSGFRLLSWSAQALDTRLELVRRAERSLDLQYYGCTTTRPAATCCAQCTTRRGVRVRLLLDDLYTAGMDALLLGLAATPNVELRLFNPFPAGRDSLGARFTASLLDFHRVNHRMHNKLFIADASIGSGLMHELLLARKEVFVSSPYFVLDRYVMQDIREARLWGQVGITLITNSLASTDEPLVHAGYQRYRHELLDLGVATTPNSASSSAARCWQSSCCAWPSW